MNQLIKNKLRKMIREEIAKTRLTESIEKSGTDNKERYQEYSENTDQVSHARFFGIRLTNK